MTSWMTLSTLSEDLQGRTQNNILLVVIAKTVLLLLHILSFVVDAIKTETGK